MNPLDENDPIYIAIDKGGGQTCDVNGVVRALEEAGYEIVHMGVDYSPEEMRDMVERTSGINAELLGIPADAIINFTVSVAPPGECDHTGMKPGWVAQMRKGSAWAYWKPGGILSGIIEAHPDHPPRLHRFCGCTEELKVGPGGAVELPSVTASDMKIEMGIGSIHTWPKGRTSGSELSGGFVGGPTKEPKPDMLRPDPSHMPDAAAHAFQMHELNKKADGGKLAENPLRKIGRLLNEQLPECDRIVEMPLGIRATLDYTPHRVEGQSTLPNEAGSFNCPGCGMKITMRVKP